VAHPQGDFYLGFESVVNAFALLFLIGLGLAAFRRYVLRPDQLAGRFSEAMLPPGRTGVHGLVRPVDGGDAPARAESTLGSLVVGWAMPSLTCLAPPTGEPPRSILSCGGAPADDGGVDGHPALYKIPAYLYRAGQHLSQPPQPPGAIPKIENIEEAEGPLGAGSIPHLSWKQLLDADACTECGRCQAVCRPTLRATAVAQAPDPGRS